MDITTFTLVRLEGEVRWDLRSWRTSGEVHRLSPLPCHLSRLRIPSARAQFRARHFNGDNMAGWFELDKSKNDQFFFTLKAGNGETILTSEQYTAKGSAENGIASVQNNCGLDERYERKVANNGKAYFNLKAANHQVIGTSQMYASTASRDAGIDSVKTNGTTKTVKDNT
jgi:uncharacterized protein YegP (UPF0339 family)